MRFSGLLALCALLLSTPAAAAGAPPCPGIQAPPAPICVAGAYGLAYADTPEEADAAAAAVREAAERYALHFGEAPVGALILSTTLDPLAAQDFAKTHGLAYALVWLPASAKREMSERAMRQAGMDRARISQALASDADQQRATLRHEVGHSMHAAMFWPDSTDESPARYGTPAPDWLDEAVAILMEPAETQARHLASFMDAAKHRPRTVPALTAFLRGEHPVRSAALARALARGPKSDSGVQMMVASGNRFAGMDTFYGQSLLVALFLAQTSGDPRILDPISRAIAGGASFDQWLASDGARHHLPSDVAALQARWDAWLKAEVLKRGRAATGKRGT